MLVNKLSGQLEVRIETELGQLGVKKLNIGTFGG